MGLFGENWRPGCSLPENSVYGCEQLGGGGEVYRKPFRVACGLQQGCILSSLLFSLFINSLVLKLKNAEVGVKCRKQLISVLLYADDAVILAEDEKLMRLGLKVLMEWCDEWGVEVNVEKSGIANAYQ